jgi:hypothetical protein
MIGAFGRDDPEFASVSKEIAAIERSSVFIAGMPR